MMPPAALAPATLTAAYEHTRAWATGGTAPGPRPPGLAVFLRRGMGGWLAVAATWLPAPVPARPALTLGASTPAVVAVDDLAGVLVAMVAACRQEAPA